MQFCNGFDNGIYRLMFSIMLMSFSLRQIQGILCILAMEILARPMGANTATSYDYTLSKARPEDYTSKHIILIAIFALPKMFPN